jgi:hypothetical protein
VMGGAARNKRRRWYKNLAQDGGRGFVGQVGVLNIPVFLSLLTSVRFNALIQC